MKAIGYVKDICTSTGEVITKEEQKEKIIQYAKLNNVNLIGILEEDDTILESILDRAEVKKILQMAGEIDTVIVERVWCFSRKYGEVVTCLDELYKIGIKIVSALTMWDCTSQKVRHYYSKRKDEPIELNLPIKKAYKKGA